MKTTKPDINKPLSKEDALIRIEDVCLRLAELYLEKRTGTQGTPEREINGEINDLLSEHSDLHDHICLS